MQLYQQRLLPVIALLPTCTALIGEVHWREVFVNVAFCISFRSSASSLLKMSKILLIPILDQRAGQNPWIHYLRQSVCKYAWHGAEVLLDVPTCNMVQAAVIFYSKGF